MNHSILIENQGKRLTLSIGLLICFAMYSSWQMGFIYFMGPSLVMQGRTPLPISMDNITLLIVAGYLFAIIYMIVFPQYVILVERLSAITALFTVLGLFLPISDSGLQILIYAQVFVCCFMIGFESFIIINYFSEKTALYHLTIAYAVNALVIALIQNDFAPLSFSAFRIIAILMLIMMLYFFFHLPTGKDACPKFIKKGDLIYPPKKLLIGICSVILVSCLMALCGPTAAAAFPNGVFVVYFSDACGAFLLYYLYKKRNIHPLHTVSIFMGLSVIGFLLLFVADYLPALAYAGCALIGLGMIPCQMLPLYGLIIMKSYPSRYITSCIMGIAVVTVVIQSALVEMFRDTPNLLTLVYLAIMVILTTMFLRLEPFLIYTLNRKIPLIDENLPTGEEAKKPANASPSAESMKTAVKKSSTLISEETLDPAELIAQLTKRELEVLELIGCGYSNSDIAKLLFISEHTVNDHTKKIYRKLNVHSRHAAANIINRYEASVQ